MPKISFIFAFMIFVFSSCEPVPVNIEQNYLLVDGRKHFISEEIANNSAGRYIFGNEDFPQVYKNLFKENENNLYLCVGSLRCFVSAGLENFSHIIFIDKDSLVTDFNRRFGQIILDRNRQQFTEWLEQDSIENKTIKVELDNFFAHDPSFTDFFWKGDEAYFRLQNALREKKIAMISGTITGGSSINSILKLIEARKWTAIYFDISNISPDFVPVKDIFNTLESINRHANLYLLFKSQKNRNGFTEYGKFLPGQYFHFYANKFDDIRIQFLLLKR